MKPRALALAPLFLLAASLPARAQAPVGSLVAPGFSPLVPVSAFARPMAWFDPSRLHFSTAVSVGTGFGGGTDALQVTSLSYQFKAPLWMRVGLGNSWGPDAAQRGNSFFLEGLDLRYQPLRSLSVSVSYRDIRTPLQLTPDYGYGFRGR